MPLCSLSQLVSSGSVFLLSFFFFLRRPQILFCFIQLQNLAPRKGPNFIFPAPYVKKSPFSPRLGFSSFLFFPRSIALSGCVPPAFTVPLCPLTRLLLVLSPLAADGLGCCNDGRCSCFSLPLPTTGQLFFRWCFPTAAPSPCFPFRSAR